MRLWFAIPFGAAMLAYPRVAEWFVLSCVALVVIFVITAVANGK